MLEKRLPFFIKGNSNLPMLKYPISEWVMDKYGITEDMLENCAVTFSMYDVNNDVYRIANKVAILIINSDRINFPAEEKYTLAYKFSLSDTSKSGQFDAEFKIDFLGDNCGKITLPANNKIQIQIERSLTKTTVTVPNAPAVLVSTFDNTFDSTFG